MDTTPAANEARQAVSETLCRVKFLRHMTDAQIGARCGWSRQKVQTKISASRGVNETDFYLLAQALDVPPKVLLMDKDEANQWVLDHPVDHGPKGGGDLRERTSRCKVVEVDFGQADANQALFAPLEEDAA